jgi:hypothetical protein
MIVVTVTARILIRGPGHDLFLFVANFENEPRWNPLVAGVAKVSEGQIRTGTLWREQLSIPLVRLTQLRRVIAYMPGTALAFENASGFPVQVAYRFVPKGKGNSTLLIASSSIRLPGSYTVFGPLIRLVVRLVTKLLLRRLKKLVETGR